MGFFDKLFGGKKQEKPAALSLAGSKGTIFSPVAGRVESTASIPDPVFASEAMGKTVAVWPSDSNVFAPVSGNVVSAMPHAFGIMDDDGAEVLVHVGIDTVNMSGDGFVVWAKAGEHVEAGTPMLSFDRDKVKAAGYKDIVMTIITNSDEFTDIESLADGTVEAGDSLIRIH